MTHKFRFLGAKTSAGSWVVTGDELHHLRKVVRLGPGNTVDVFDGKGAWGEGVIEFVTSEAATVAVAEERETSRPSQCLTLLLGALDHGAFDDLVAPLTEVGVMRVVCFGAQGTSKSRLDPKAVERWRRLALSAAKQAKRAFVPEILAAADLERGLAELSPQERSGVRLLLDPAGETSMLDAALGAGAVTVALGPEKGFAVGERQRLLEEGFVLVQLGDHILRSVTAALVSSAVLCLRLSPAR